MHPSDQAYQIQKIDRQYERDQSRFKPGWDDARTYYEEKAFTWNQLTPSQKLWRKGWPSESVKDAVEWANDIKFLNEYCMKWYGETYAENVERENHERRKHWLREGL